MPSLERRGQRYLRVGLERCRTGSGQNGVRTGTGVGKRGGLAFTQGFPSRRCHARRSGGSRGRRSGMSGVRDPGP